jgi:N-acetyl-gamma-glutamyl-phosphate reductase common form
LLGHPLIKSILPTARGDESFCRVHPNLLGSGLEFVTVDELADRAGELDVVFFSTPTGEAMRSARHYLEHGVRVIDLSADFRFADPLVYQRVHGPEHLEPELLADAVYGVTELFREHIAKTNLVANPGCYAITAILALAPLLTSGHARLDVPVAVHAVNGTTGAGTTPKKALMHAEVAGSMLAYGLDGHRHGPELETVFGELTGRNVVVDLNTTHGDFARGIHLQANVALDGELDRDALIELYLAHYGRGHEGEYFVLVNDRPRREGRNAKEYALYPNITSVLGTNFCHVGVDVDRDRGIAKVVAVTDNLVKGAAGSAIQNMNTMLGVDQTRGLRHYAV